MLRIDQPSTIGMGIVAFVTVDSQSSSDHRQIGYQGLADQGTDLPTTMKPLNRAAGGMCYGDRRSLLASGGRQTIAINTPGDAKE